MKQILGKKIGLKDEKRTKWMKSVKEREKRLIEREGKEKERERERYRRTL